MPLGKGEEGLLPAAGPNLCETYGTAPPSRSTCLLSRCFPTLGDLSLWPSRAAVGRLEGMLVLRHWPSEHIR